MTHLSIWLCKECGHRWWTEVGEDYRKHWCPRTFVTGEPPLIARIDVEGDFDAEVARDG